MRRRDTYWSLFHSPEKRQLNDLRTDHVEAIFDALPEKDQKDWLIWKEGFREWKPLKDFPQILVGMRQRKSVESVSPIPAPPSSSKAQFKNAIHDKGTAVFDRLQKSELESTSPVELSLSEEGALAERDTRFPKKWEVRIYSENKVYSNQTVNISLHGMQLRDPVPPGLTPYFNVEVKAADMRIPLLCSEIKNEDGKPSHRVRIESNDNQDALQTALLQK